MPCGDAPARSVCSCGTPSGRAGPDRPGRIDHRGCGGRLPQTAIPRGAPVSEPVARPVDAGPVGTCLVTGGAGFIGTAMSAGLSAPVSYTHLRAHETRHD